MAEAASAPAVAVGTLRGDDGRATRDPVVASANGPRPWLRRFARTVARALTPGSAELVAGREGLTAASVSGIRRPGAGAAGAAVDVAGRGRCPASGWGVRRACCEPDGATIACPICDKRVPASPSPVHGRAVRVITEHRR